MKVYDADQVTVSFAGVLMQGYADGEFCSIEMDSKGFEDVVGTDGEVTRSKTGDNRATVTVKLLQSSLTNAELSILHNLDLSAPNGAGVGALLINDRGGSFTYRAARAWISKAPDVTLDRQATTREWEFRCEKLVRFDGAA